MLKLPKSDSRFGWTRHIKNKMVYYHLSAAQVLRIFRFPDRREEGVAPNTIAAMKVRKKVSASKSAMQRGLRNSEEIWMMYRISGGRQKSSGSKVVLISAWRYPGRTKPGERVPVPVEILDELKAEGLI